MHRAVCLSKVFFLYFSHFLQGVPITCIARKKITITVYTDKIKQTKRVLSSRNPKEKRNSHSRLSRFSEVSTSAQGGMVLLWKRQLVS